jgi:hypothetical protein
MPTGNNSLCTQQPDVLTDCGPQASKKSSSWALRAPKANKQCRATLALVQQKYAETQWDVTDISAYSDLNINKTQ